MKDKIKLSEFLPIIIFICISLVFLILTKGKIFQQENLIALVNQSITTIIAGLGMIFVASMGGTDITHGSLVALTGTVAAMAASRYGMLWTFPAAIIVGLLSGLFLGVVNAKLKVPSFMVSLAMLIAIRAFVNWILNANVVFATEGVLNLDNFSYKIPILLLLILVVGYIYKYTPFGNYCRAIGENENAIKFIGIKVDRVKIMAFVVSGVMASIAGVFTIARIGGASNTMGAGFEMRVMMAMFIGGIPVSGGMDSKLYKLIIGAPTIILLENGLVICGLTGAVTQGIRGAILLFVVWLTLMLNKRMLVSEDRRNRQKMVKQAG